MTSDCVSSKIDPQYFVDNMLTDEDFQFETDDFLDVPLEDQNILESFRKELQLENQSRQLNGGNTQGLDFVDNMDFCNSTIDDILKDCFKDADIKTEPLSPCSNGMTSPESDTSVINIPDEDSNSGINLVLSETPPQTPPGLLEQVPNSPPNGSCTPIVVSLSAVPTLTYVVPPTKKLSVINPVKPRVSIQPKPTSNNPNNTTSTLRSNSNAGHSFSSDQLVKLPNGIFRVKEPIPSILKPTAQTRTAKSANFTNGKNGMKKSDLIEVCTAALKRQERIIKNRESASLSRKRKREYVQKIEEELNQVAAENASLKEENCRLKNRIIDLENEVTKLKAAFTSKGMKKTVCLMVAVCMLTFNFASFGSIFDKVSLKPMKTDTENHRVGRILLWNEENSSREVNSSSPLLHNNFLKEEDDTSLIASWNKYYNTSTCQQFINKSESLRLENDLLGWVKRVEKKQKQKDSKLNKNSVKTVVPPFPKLQQLGLKRGIREDIWAKKKNRNEILIYQTPRKDYEDFFDAIHRRDDSFYFISFSGDHLLLPAIAHNQTLRPRMSFVMPAMILNDSVDEADDHISMMQIDCEVMDTKLVHIKESVIPSHLRQKHNNSSKANSKNYTKYSVNRNSKRIHDSTVKLPDKPSENG
ncbi:cyclic AMP-dependent transcription factor ATF-6 alpha-like [Argiope bruennichi]|uniref:cyclic AMP-dependent transcription factor ATF-6 alpha-like n=1 Tax=Argiope bruennichi TaxID=94029 RepID=UPI0024942075|nr:cyclic AMP-dependent transcription factor ATF-6 alpha-like [Argiope bruennichi]